MARVNVDDGVLVSAVRYALGRHTYVVKETCDSVRDNLRLIQRKLLVVMIRDIDEHFGRHGKSSAFGEQDDVEWRDLRNDIEEFLGEVKMS